MMRHFIFRMEITPEHENITVSLHYFRRRKLHDHLVLENVSLKSRRRRTRVRVRPTLRFQPNPGRRVLGQVLPPSFPRRPPFWLQVGKSLNWVCVPRRLGSDTQGCASSAASSNVSQGLQPRKTLRALKGVPLSRRTREALTTCSGDVPKHCETQKMISTGRC